MSVDGHAALPEDKVWGGEELRVDPSPDPRSLPDLPEAIPLDDRLRGRGAARDRQAAGTRRPSGQRQLERNAAERPARSRAGGRARAARRHRPSARQGHERTARRRARRWPRRPTSCGSCRPAPSRANTWRSCTAGSQRDRTIEAPIGRHPVQRTRMAVVSRGKPAVTHVHVPRAVMPTRRCSLPARNRPHAPDPRAPRLDRPSADRRSRLRVARGTSIAFPPPGAARGNARARAPVSRDAR